MPNKKTAKAPAPATLLIEVLTEELPPRALKRLSEAFALLTRLSTEAWIR